MGGEKNFVTNFHIVAAENHPVLLGLSTSRYLGFFVEHPLVLYNVLLPINHYIDYNTTKHHSGSMSDNRDLTETFHQKISSVSKVIVSVSRYFQSS